MASKKELQRQIDKLREQIKENLVEREVPDTRYPVGFTAYDYYGRGSFHRPMVTVHKLTLAGKVDAIINHLGIELEVEQKKTTTKTTGPSVKVKKVTKKRK